MVPWPLALLSLFYGVIAAASSAGLWRAVTGVSQQPVLWPVLWLSVSAGAMCGLALLKAWGRVLAIAGFIALCAVMLAMAGLLAAAGRPAGAVLSAALAGVHILAIRYLQREATKAYFNTTALEQRGN